MKKANKDHIQYGHVLSMILLGIILMFICFFTHADVINDVPCFVHPYENAWGNMKEIEEIIVHCSATPEGKDFTVDQLTEWHQQRGFRTIGYHYVIDLQGTIHAGRPPTMVGAHCRGHNARSIGICYIGGLACDGKTPMDTRTEAQKRALAHLLQVLHAQYPQATLHGHREFTNKACPSFDCHEYDSIFDS